MLNIFKKISIADLIIGVIILAVIALFFHIYMILGKTPNLIPYQWVRVTAVFFATPEVAKLIKEGDVSFGKHGRLEAKLIKIIKEIGTEKETALKHKNLIEVFVEFDLLCTKASPKDNWFHQMERLYAGLSDQLGIVFETDRYRIRPHILEFHK